MTNLECSSRGDKRFSAFYAKVSVYGKMDSIENHYQLSKRFCQEIPTNWRDGKGRMPTHLVIGVSEYPGDLKDEWYYLLWAKYLDDRPDLVSYASQFDSFSDMFAGGATVTQAEAVRMYVKDGRDSVMQFCSRLLNLMRK